MVAVDLRGRGDADLLVADALRLPAAGWRASLHGLVAGPPPTDLGTITAPTLVVSGGRDIAAFLPRVAPSGP